MKVLISKRKLESYKRAEKVARECRYQMVVNRINMPKLASYVISWMRKTGDIKNQRPVERRGARIK